MPLTRKKLQQLIKDAKKSNDWSKVEHTDVSEIKDMSDLFSECKNIEYLDLSNWNVSNVTSMNSMFEWSDFNNDSISQWDVSNVENMGYMFLGSKYNQPLNDWDVSNVENMMYMFQDSYFNNDSISQWNVSNVENMGYMFCNSQYNQLLNDWDVSNVKNMRSMFAESQYNHPLNDWGVSNVEDMESMFAESQYNQPLNNWNVSNVKNILFIFYGSLFCGNISSWNTESLCNESYNDNNDGGVKYISLCKKYFPLIDRIINNKTSCEDYECIEMFDFLLKSDCNILIQKIDRLLIDQDYNTKNSSNVSMLKL